MESIEHDFYLNPITIGLLLLAILTLCIHKSQGRTKLPPGPWHIPFVGNAWELGADPDLRKSLGRLHKQYGDIYRLYMGPKLAVVISGYEAIKEMFVKRGGEFSDRPESLIYSILAENQEKQLGKTVLDLFGAGAETTTTTITWALLYLAAKQDIQARVFREINEIVGTDRLPSLQDKRKLVYTEAFIMEILRACNIATVSFPRTCKVDTKFRGFDIPKGTILLADIDSVLFDPVIWGDPEEFRPERFIGEDGNLLNPEEFIPFFTGRRNCVGESLARMELDLFIPALVQRYEFLPPEGTVLGSKELEGVFSLTHKPKPFEIRAIKRKKEANLC